MKPVAIIMAAAMGASTSATRGQAQERMDYLLSLVDEGGNGNGIVEPGEAVGLSVNARFWPDVGQPAIWHNHGGPVGIPGVVYGYAGSIIDVNGLEGSATGSLAFSVPAPLSVGLPGMLIPTTQSVMDSNSGQLVFLPLLPGTQANPVEIFRGTWTPVDYEARTLRYGVSVDSGAIYLLVGLPQPVGENTINTGTEASISIVPGPGAAVALLIASPHIALRRRRRP